MPSFALNNEPKLTRLPEALELVNGPFPSNRLERRISEDMPTFERQKQNLSDDSDDDQPEDLDSALKEIIGELGTAIGRLYRVCYQAQQQTATRRPRLSGDLAFDPEYDVSHIREKLYLWSGQQDHNVYLVNRLGAANTMRRRQFLYLSSHAERLESIYENASAKTANPEPVVPNPTNKEPIRTLQATVASLVVVTNEEMDTFSSYANTPADTGMFSRIPPPFPFTEPDQQYFMCPYCFTVLPRLSFLSQIRWK